jgi:ABC-type spermidine/putrescine transport system permease subunit I
MPTDVRAIASLALSENYAFVDTVSTAILGCMLAFCMQSSKRYDICLTELLQLQLAVSVLVQVYTTFGSFSDRRLHVLVQELRVQPGSCWQNAHMLISIAFCMSKTMPTDKLLLCVGMTLVHNGLYMV